jgi:iron(III) transport system substrate-binding protein
MRNVSQKPVGVGVPGILSRFVVPAIFIIGSLSSAVQAEGYAAGGGRNVQPHGMAAPILLAQASKAAPASLQADLDALLKAARAEGELTFYSSTPEGVSKKASEAFFAKYGVKANYLRLASAPLQQRFSAEADANNLAADVLITLGASVPFAEEGIKKGWIESISQASLPAIRSGEFPARFNMGPTALIQINPWLIAYNTEKLKPADAPKDWSDLLNPRFKGQIIIPDTRVTDAYSGFWSLILDRYGESFFTQLRAQNFRQIGSGIPAMQGVAAGEAMITFPAISATVQEPKSKGAPLAMVTPERTTGSESHIMLTSRARSKHPNAGRLFANWVLTQEGNLAFNKDSGSTSVFDTTGLPRQYESPKGGTAAWRDQLAKLLGFQ